MGRATARVGRCSARRSPCSAPGGSPDPEIPPDAFSAVLFYAGLPSRWTGNSKGRAKHAIASEVRQFSAGNRFGLDGAFRRLDRPRKGAGRARSEEHTSELPSLIRISYAVFCLKQKNNKSTTETSN